MMGAGTGRRVVDTARCGGLIVSDQDSGHEVIQKKNVDDAHECCLAYHRKNLAVLDRHSWTELDV